MKFAISVPIGAWHPFLPWTLRSLKAQGELVNVAILDASGDSRVKSLAEKHADWIRYRRHGPDKGQSDAILEGWRELEGEWLGWLNADDILMPGALSAVQRSIRDNPEVDVLYGHSAILDDEARMTGYHFNVEPPGPRLLSAGIVSQPSCFFRRASYDSVGGLNPELHYVMDWDLWIRMYLSGARFSILPHNLSMVLWGRATKTASIKRARRGELNAIIQRYAPHSARQNVYRDFLIHAVTDRLYPLALRRHFQKRFRSVSQSPFGVRGDGNLAPSSQLIFAHYQETSFRAVEIKATGDIAELDIQSSHHVEMVSNHGESMRIGLKSGVEPGVRFSLTIQRHDEAMVHFKSAQLLT